MVSSLCSVLLGVRTANAFVISSSFAFVVFVNVCERSRMWTGRYACVWWEAAGITRVASDIVGVKPNTHGRLDATVELSRVGVGGVYWVLCDARWYECWPHTCATCWRIRVRGFRWFALMKCCINVSDPNEKARFIECILQCTVVSNPTTVYFSPRYSTVYTTTVLSVRPSVCLLHSLIVLKRLNISS